MDNNVDYKRPIEFPSGVLLNTNNEALTHYKRAKRRMSTIPELERKVEMLENKLLQLLERLDDPKS